MATRSLIFTGAMTAALLSAFLRVSEAQDGHSAQAWQPFMTEVQEYVALHRRLEQRIGAPKISRNAGEILASVNALADELHAARASAKAGDVLGGETALLLRQRIVEVLRERRIEPSALLASAEDEETLAPRPVVNERYSWSWPSFAPPPVLAALPVLPKELQYRFVGRDLVLVDVEANLVVDVLPNAWP